MYSLLCVARARTMPKKPAFELRLQPPTGLKGKRFSVVDGEQFAVLVVPIATSDPHTSELTAAEREVAKLVLQGFSNEEIAALRGARTRTVANQLQAAYRKLGIGSRVELARISAGEAGGNREAVESRAEARGHFDGGRDAKSSTN